MLTILRHIIQEVSGAENFSEALDIMVKRIANARWKGNLGNERLVRQVM